VAEPWPVRATVAVVVLLTLGLRARHGDRRLVAVAIATTVLALLHLVLPEATPRAVRLWTPAFVWLAVEAAAAAVGRSTPGGRGLRVAAGVAEVLAIPIALAAVALVLGPATSGGVGRVVASGGADPVVAGLLVIAAGAWSVAAVRLQRDGVVAAAPFLGVLAAWHVLAATVLFGVAVELTVVLALGAALVPGLVRWLGRRRPVTDARQLLDLSSVLLVLLAAGSLAEQRTAALLVALVAPVAVLPLLAPVAARGTREMRAATAIVAGLLVIGVASSADTGVQAAQLPDGVVGLVVGVTALAIALATAGCRPVAESGRVLATVAGLVTTLPTGWLLPPGGTAAPVSSVETLGLGPGALLPAALLAVLLLLDAVADRGAVARTGATLVLLRPRRSSCWPPGWTSRWSVPCCWRSARWPRSAWRSVLGRWLASSWRWVPGSRWWRSRSGGSCWAMPRCCARPRCCPLGPLPWWSGSSTARPPLAHTGAAIATLGTGRCSRSSTAPPWTCGCCPWPSSCGWRARLPAGTARSPPGWPTPRRSCSSGCRRCSSGSPAVRPGMACWPGRSGSWPSSSVAATRSVARWWSERGLVVAVVVVETLTVVVSLPTWAWLTVGGLVLLVAAASIERLGQSPAEAARRVAIGLRDPQRS
jgi:hypothetical protein